MKQYALLTMAWMLLVLPFGAFAAPSGIYLPIRVLESEAASLWLLEAEDAGFVTINLAFEHAGTAHVPPEKAGLPYLLAQLFGRATQEKNQQLFKEALQVRGIRLSASVTEDRFMIHLQTLSEELETALTLLKEALLNPLLSEDFLNQMKQEVLTGLHRAEAQPEWQAQQLLLQLLYGDHPYTWPQQGSKTTLATITGEDIQTFMTRHFIRPKLSVSVSGQVDAVTAQTLISHLVEGLPQAGDDAPQALPQATLSEAQTGQHEMNAPQSAIAFALPGVGYHHPDFFPLLVANHILGGGGFGSLLMDDIRERQGLVYSINSYLDISPAASLLRGSAGTRPESVPAVEESLRNMLTKLQQEGVDEAALRRAKTYMTNNYVLRFDSVRRMASMLSFMQLEGFAPDYPATRNEKIMAVTAAEVNRIFATYFTPQKLYFVSAGKKMAE